MERNHEVTAVQPLLDSRGELREPGWSRSPVQSYDRGAIRAPKWRIKEWDYYLVLSDGFAGAFTISDDGYIGLQSVSLRRRALGAYGDGAQPLPDGEAEAACGLLRGRYGVRRPAPPDAL